MKIWLEESADQAPRARWRGHITHVPSGQRRYIQDLVEIVTFMVPFLAEMGITISDSRGPWRRRRAATYRRPGRR